MSNLKTSYLKQPNPLAGYRRLLMPQLRRYAGVALLLAVTAILTVYIAKRPDTGYGATFRTVVQD